MSIRLIPGDCRDVLPTLAANSVQCCITSPPYYALRSYLDASHPDKHREIGSESSPDAYLATMVAVFREVKRVLRPDGTCWVNQGDLFVNKQLQMMPARFALALQADGWWVRSDIIWHKPNPMPESCTDRPTSAHEHVFLLTKSARYFYDADAVREEAEYGSRPGTNWARAINGSTTDKRRPDVMTVSGGDPSTGRNLRNVWTIATSPFSAAHFATFPPELAERCIRAGTSERGCCAACGKPWVRMTERGASIPARSGEWKATGEAHRNDIERKGGFYDAMSTTTGWSPGCACNAGIVPCTVLDPFAGAGTTLLCSDRLQRDAIGIELNTAYTEMAMERCRADAPLFTSFPPAEPPEEERMADLFAEAAE